MTSAYGQVPLHGLTEKHCNFQSVVGGKSTGKYRFITRLFGLTVMTTEFRKLMGLNLVNPNKFTLEHLNIVREVMNVLEEAILQLKAQQCVLAQDSIEWLGNKLTRTGISQ